MLTIREIKKNRPVLLLISSILFSILFNIFLFCLMPALVSKGVGKKTEPMDLNPISFASLKKNKPPEIKKEKEKIKPEKKIFSTKRVYASKSINLPKLSFKINPQLSGGTGFIQSPPMIDFNFSNFGLKNLFKIGEVDNSPVPVAQIPPIYPVKAKRLGIEGWVNIQFIVTENGTVENIEILDANPKNIFNRSVLRCISSWRFSPGILEGEPVNTQMITTIRFELE